MGQPVVTPTWEIAVQRILELMSSSFDFLWKSHDWPDCRSYSITSTVLSHNSGAAIIESSILRMRLVLHQDDYSLRIEPAMPRRRNPWSGLGGFSISTFRNEMSGYLSLSDTLTLSHIRFLSNHLAEIEDMATRQSWKKTSESLTRALNHRKDFVAHFRESQCISPALTELRARLGTVASASREIEVIKCVMGLSDAEMMNNKDQFRRFIMALDESHNLSGVFGLTPSNESDFLDFSRWLAVRNQSHNLYLDQAVDDFGVTFQEVSNAFPSLSLPFTKS